MTEAKRRRREKEYHKRKDPDSRRMDYRDTMKQRKPKRDARSQINDRRPRTPPRLTDVLLSPLNAPIA